MLTASTSSAGQYTRHIRRVKKVEPNELVSEVIDSVNPYSLCVAFNQVKYFHM